MPIFQNSTKKLGYTFSTFPLDDGYRCVDPHLPGSVASSVGSFFVCLKSNSALSNCALRVYTTRRLYSLFGVIFFVQIFVFQKVWLGWAPTVLKTVNWLNFSQNIFLQLKFDLVTGYTMGLNSTLSYIQNAWHQKIVTPDTFTLSKN